MNAINLALQDTVAHKAVGNEAWFTCNEWRRD
jgi:hypothetical protein